MLAQVESKLGISVIHVNVDAKGSPAFRTYSPLFQGGSIPYTVLIDAGGKKIRDWTGAYRLEDFTKEVQRNMR